MTNQSFQLAKQANKNKNCEEVKSYVGKGILQLNQQALAIYVNDFITHCLPVTQCTLPLSLSAPRSRAKQTLSHLFPLLSPDHLLGVEYSAH